VSAAWLSKSKGRKLAALFYAGALWELTFRPLQPGNPIPMVQSGKRRVSNAVHSMHLHLSADLA
jgi:hypothetical protein